MPSNIDLFNAAVVGENSDSAVFIVDGKHLHAVDVHVAALKNDKAQSEQITPLLREALKALVKFSMGKVEPHFLEIDYDSVSKNPKEQAWLVDKIAHIYSHLPHHDRNELSSLIHHKQK